jgi:regulation of enolase protein 1 (concanavalin A-like superfamily)
MHICEIQTILTTLGSLKQYMIENNKIQTGFSWLNQPEHSITDNKLRIKTSPDTDFWQRTHYGFQRDNGHCLIMSVKGDFSMTVRTEFYPNEQYDQCGLIVRNNAENWIKTSTEYENPGHSRLGSVVTNSGYSDWATIDSYSQIHEMWYRIRSENNDFTIEYSHNGTTWHQLRMTHLLQPFNELQVGIYACSPKKSSFEAIFNQFELGERE